MALGLPGVTAAAFIFVPLLAKFMDKFLELILWLQRLVTLHAANLHFKNAPQALPIYSRG